MTVKVYARFLGEGIFLILLTLWVGVKKLVRIVVKPPPKSLAGEVILVTGGGNGIGREICRKLAQTESDMTLIIWDVADFGSKGQEVVEELNSMGVKSVHWFQVDVSKRDQVQTTAEKIRSSIGNVTMLFNNAGIAGESCEGWKMDPDQVEQVFGVNVLAMCWTLREFLPPMISKGKGHIVVTNSVLGFSIWQQSSAYIASKHGQRAYIECIKEDVRHQPEKPDIVFTMVYPHNTNTPLAEVFNVKSTKYPFLMPLLDPKDVASTIVCGVLQNDEHIFVPRSASLLPSAMGCVPSEVFRKACDLSGVYCDHSKKNQ